MATESTARESAASRQSRVPLAGIGPDQPVRGVFRMGRSFVRLSQRNDPYRIVELVDSSGALRCYGWTAPFVHAAPIPEWSLVDVEFRSYQYQQGVAGRLSALAPAASPTPDDQLETLPATLCPVPGVVGRLIKIVAEIGTPLLREFVARVLSDPVLARAFFRVPASFIDHHAWPGGTAEHSVEMASNAARIEGLSELDRDLAIVNSLFHDIGKTETHDQGGIAFEAFKTVGHDALTLYLLAGPLRWLATQWPTGALALRLGWVAAAEGNRFGARAMHPAADVVRGMDRISRASAMHRVHFPAPGGFRFLSHGRVLWSPRVPTAK